ncbi:MAG: hypothetical protein L0Y66_10240 [Myxococcaceae bacterium]|nr:hypothetical protein [Myxococcaceae bacterium]MCI0671255.1 hypothetical protein [Myxococcaceae bacterium]
MEVETLQTPREAARCAREGNASVAACTRCGSFVCATCVRVSLERPACPACWARMKQQGSPRVRTALLLATLGLVTFVPGPIALWLALAELRAMKRGEAFPGGEEDARLARNLGLVETAALLLALAGFTLGS